jgi:hypothetical protein
MKNGLVRVVPYLAVDSLIQQSPSYKATLTTNHLSYQARFQLREVVSLEGDNLVVFYYGLCKRGGLS